MYAETEDEPAFNSDSSFFARDQSINCQTNEYSSCFYWDAYFHHMNQQLMMNFPSQVRSLNLTENHLNPSHLLIQQCNYTPMSTSSLTSSANASSLSNMKDLCRFNPSNSSKNGKNPRTDNNSLKCRPNCDEWILRDNINKYMVNGAPSNQCTISKDLADDCSKTIDVYDHGYNEHKNEIQSNLETSKVMKRCTSHQIRPINQPQFMDKYQTNECAVVNESQMDDIIAKELDLALSLSRIGRRNSRVHRLYQQAKAKTRPKSGKRSSIKNRLISVTVERIKAAVFSCNPNPSSFQKHKISDHEVNQKSKQNQPFSQPESSNQYQAHNILGQYQYPQLMCQPKSGFMVQPADLKLVDRKPERFCTCKSYDARMDNDMPSSSSSASATASNHSNIPADNLTRMDHSIYSLLRR